MTRMKIQRDWYFRYIICLHLLSVSSTSSTLPAQMKAMSAGLAVKSLQKAASDVVPDPDFVKDPSATPGTPGQVLLKNPSTASRSIETQKELDLLIEILQRQHKYTELAVILSDDTRTGIRSRVGNTFGTLKDKVKTLQLAEDWETLWSVCDDLLRPIYDSSTTAQMSSFAKLADDWQIWDAYLQAALQLYESRPDRINESLALASDADRTGQSQNAALLLINHGLRNADIHAKLGYNVKQSCEQYFAQYCQKPFLFSQLRHISLLEPSQRAEFLSFARQTCLERSQKTLDSKVSSLH